MRGRAGKIKAGDLVLVLLIVVAAAASVVLVSRASAGEKGSLAVVEVNGKEVKRIALGPGLAKRTIVVRGPAGESVLEVEGGRVHMTESACRDKVCIGMGWADNAGDTIICLPNRVVIRVEGRRKANGVDTVVE